MLTMDAEDVAHFPQSVLSKVLSLNISSMLATLSTSHVPISLLNVLLSKSSVIIVMSETS